MIKSPFRYPGGKSRLLEWILPHIPKVDVFIDVFAGGGSVMLAVAERDKDCQIHINDADIGIANFWKCVIDDSLVNSLITDIAEHKPSVELFLEIQKCRLNLNQNDIVKSAFSTIVCNRQSFSGIGISGPIGGMFQKSRYKIDCRWSVDYVIKSILQCHELLKLRTVVTNNHFRNVLSYAKTSNCHFYIDPPYYQKGNSLYYIGMTKCEHKELCEMLKKMNNWTLSYDNHTKILELYDFCTVLSKNQHSMLARKDKGELLLFPNDTSN